VIASCENCEFVFRFGEEGERLSCRRFPPVPVQSEIHGVESNFPEVDKRSWCGEWKLDESESHKAK
jgi:hypothetical protein